MTILLPPPQWVQRSPDYDASRVHRQLTETAIPGWKSFKTNHKACRPYGMDLIGSVCILPVKLSTPATWRLCVWLFGVDLRESNPIADGMEGDGQDSNLDLDHNRVNLGAFDRIKPCCMCVLPLKLTSPSGSQEGFEPSMD